jgi:hypothetical protein
MKTFVQWACPYCNKRIKAAGFAKASHLRSHIKQGLVMTEKYLDNDGFYRERFTSTPKGAELLKSKGYK